MFLNFVIVAGSASISISPFLAIELRDPEREQQTEGALKPEGVSSTKPLVPRISLPGPGVQGPSAATEEKNEASGDVKALAIGLESGPVHVQDVVPRISSKKNWMKPGDAGLRDTGYACKGRSSWFSGPKWKGRQSQKASPRLASPRVSSLKTSPRRRSESGAQTGKTRAGTTRAAGKRALSTVPEEKPRDTGSLGPSVDGDTKHAGHSVVQEVITMGRSMGPEEKNEFADELIAAGHQLKAEGNLLMAQGLQEECSEGTDSVSADSELTDASSEVVPGRAASTPALGAAPLASTQPARDPTGSLCCQCLDASNAHPSTLGVGHGIVAQNRQYRAKPFDPPLFMKIEGYTSQKAVTKDLYHKWQIDKCKTKCQASVIKELDLIPPNAEAGSTSTVTKKDWDTRRESVKTWQEKRLAKARGERDPSTIKHLHPAFDWSGFPHWTATDDSGRRGLTVRGSELDQTRFAGVASRVRRIGVRVWEPSMIQGAVAPPERCISTAYVVETPRDASGRFPGT